MSEKTELPPNPANYAALTPISFLSRTADVYPQHIGVIHGTRRFTWAQVHDRCRRFASALQGLGIGPGDTVAVMAPNVPLLLEAHFAVPMAGAILNAINTRLDPAAIAYILEHSEAKILIADTEYHAVIRKALALLPRPLRVIDSEDPEGPGGERLGAIDYEALLASGDPAFEAEPPGDEWDSIAVNYTSGTTGNPKGVLYHHRGAYLNALGNTLVWDFGRHPVYLWTLPMFHCNGWCFPWTVTLAAGTHVCLRRVDGAGIWAAIAAHGVTHLCGAPIVMQLILDAAPAGRDSSARKLRMMTAAAPPPAAVLAAMQAAGFEVTHVYGLTEVYGPAVVCAWHEDWEQPAHRSPGRSQIAPGRALSRAGRADGRRSRDGPGRAGRWRDPRRGDDARQYRHEGLSEGRGRHRQGLPRRLVSHRRSRRRPSRRLCSAEGPFQGHHHLGRGEHLLHRGGECPLSPSRRGDRRRRRHAR